MPPCQESLPAGCAANLPFIIKKFQYILCAKWRAGRVTFRRQTAPTRCHLMALNRIHTHFGRLLAVWIAVAGLMAAEHHGTVKSGGLPVPGASVTATKGDKKLYTTTDENGRYSFADLADGSWTIEVEMLGFAKLSNEVGIAFDAPAPEWNLKFLSMSAISGGRGAHPAPAAAPAGARGNRGEYARARPRQTGRPLRQPGSPAPKPAASGTPRRGQRPSRTRRPGWTRPERRQRWTALPPAGRRLPASQRQLLRRSVGRARHRTGGQRNGRPEQQRRPVPPGQRQRQPRPRHAAAERLVRRSRRSHGRHGRRPRRHERNERA